MKLRLTAKQKHDRRVRFGTIGLCWRALQQELNTLQARLNLLNPNTDALSREFLMGKIDGISIAIELVGHVRNQVEYET